MEESAEWRLQYDIQHERASNCERELIEVRKNESSSEFSKKFEALQKENAALLKNLEILNSELNAEKLKCISRKLH
ncbi:hypothetical protein SAY86_018620 [Trapa natans]|uniref:Uncharacterized protein n=1 Tax=Trapa natans TaxID=22666 RepID=A0AAN7LR83_TRANT|nr:hypothetical protein SAY86_018620 [Trapa natans]